MSEPSPEAFSSVPGAMWPGAIQPGAVGAVTETPDVLFAFGDARWAWEAGAPRWAWQTGDARQAWAFGAARNQ